MHHLEKGEVDELHTAIDGELKDVEVQLRDHGHIKNERGEWEAQSKSEGEEPDHTDAADNIEELVTNVPLVQELSARHRALEDALVRMKDGTYGHCEVCGEEIPIERLRANPAARTCIKHAT
jgi:RNA polymerase-binding transcription factor DksA